MAISEAKKRADARYRKNAVTSKSVRFFPKDKELLEFALEQAGSSFGAYMRELIRKDMEEKRQNSL